MIFPYFQNLPSAACTHFFWQHLQVNVLLSRPFLVPLAQIPSSIGLGLADPFVKDHLLTQFCSQKQLLSTANAEALDISGTLCHTVLGH